MRNFSFLNLSFVHVKGDISSFIFYFFLCLWLTSASNTASGKTAFWTSLNCYFLFVLSWSRIEATSYSQNQSKFTFRSVAKFYNIDRALRTLIGQKLTFYQSLKHRKACRFIVLRVWNLIPWGKWRGLNNVPHCDKTFRKFENTCVPVCPWCFITE